MSVMELLLTPAGGYHLHTIGFYNALPRGDIVDVDYK